MDGTQHAADSERGSESGTDGAAELTTLVGARVRLLRSRHGLTRRELSAAANVSERYLGQVEKGQANITVGLLYRIASTFKEPVSAILPLENAPGRISAPLFDLLTGMTESEQAEAYQLLLRGLRRTSASTTKGIALIGLRGAGKTTLGRKLADRHKLPFIRISDVIQDIAGMATGELLEMTGQNAYRRLEYEALEKTVSGHGRVIVEAGGGLVHEARSYNMLLRHFHTVWVLASPEEYMQRVIDQGDMRPMAGNSRAMDDLREIMSEREPLYRQADQALDTSGRSVDESFGDLERITEGILS